MMLYKTKTTSPARKTVLLALATVTLATAIVVQCMPSAAQVAKAPVSLTNTDSFDAAPEFPGGLDSLMSFLSQNIRYPEAARKQHIQGRVILKFIVDKDGAIKDISLLRDLPAGCGDEAKRMVAAMPKWNPGLKDGQPVNVSYVLPITFALRD